VSDVPGVPSAEELSALPAAELAARLAEAYRLIAELTRQVGRLSARDAASTARQAGQSALDAVVLEDLVARYRALAAAGLAANLYRRTATATDARRIARRFLGFEDLILRFATRPDLDIFSNNEAERTIRPVKVQQRSSGGCWRTIDGLADFALIQSYLSTAAKWGISKPDALRDLFNGRAWLPPGLEPA
jgi:transposase